MAVVNNRVAIKITTIVRRTSISIEKGSVHLLFVRQDIHACYCVSPDGEKIRRLIHFSIDIDSLTGNLAMLL
jgi:hypothetical protein